MTPTGRGYHHYVGYYNAAEEYFTHITGAYCGRGPSGAAYPCPSCPGLDFHNGISTPSSFLQGAFPHKEASADTQDSDGKPLLRPLHDYTTYSTEVYAKEAVRIIDSHASGQAKGPFYIYAAFQALHAPLQVPKFYLDSPACAEVGEVNRHIFCGMAQALDSGVGNITAALTAGGFADNTVVFWSTDNGGQNGAGGNVRVAMRLLDFVRSRLANQKASVCRTGR